LLGWNNARAYVIEKAKILLAPIDFIAVFFIIAIIADALNNIIIGKPTVDNEDESIMQYWEDFKSSTISDRIYIIVNIAYSLATVLGSLSRITKIAFINTFYNEYIDNLELVKLSIMKFRIDEEEIMAERDDKLDCSTDMKVIIKRCRQLGDKREYYIRVLEKTIKYMIADLQYEHRHKPLKFGSLVFLTQQQANFVRIAGVAGSAAF